MSNHIDDPLKLRWDKETSQYRVNKPSTDQAELIDANIGIELLCILHNIRLEIDRLDLSNDLNHHYLELSRGIDLLTGTEQLSK